MGVGSKLLRTIVSVQLSLCSTNCLCIDCGSLLYIYMPEQMANTVIGIVQFVPIFLHDLLYCVVGIMTQNIVYCTELIVCLNFTSSSNRCT